MDAAEVARKRTALQRCAAVIATPLLLVGLTILLTRSGPDKLSLTILVLANAIIVVGIVLGSWLYPRRLR